MKALRFTLAPLTAFGTPLAGDTLFGHLCWALVMRRGAPGLGELLDGYTEGRPFAVLSDAFPAGVLPKPTLPDAVAGLAAAQAGERKALRLRAWLPADGHARPLAQWLASAVEADNGTGAVVTQNSINRLTGTTGRDSFAPRQVEQIAFAADARLDLYAVLDEARLPAADLRAALDDIGAGGYGRDASSGLGKFEVLDMAPSAVAPSGPWRRAMALAPCAFDPAAVDTAHCHWLPLTRFGRHGGVAALGGGGGPFKRPLMLARTGAYVASRGATAAMFHGSGLGGTGRPLSDVIPATVHQGYAPLVALNHGDTP